MLRVRIGAAACVCLGLLAVLAVGPARAAINLEWRPLTQTVGVGDPLGVGLYAVSDSGQNQYFSAAQVIMQWDPVFLRLTGNSTVGAIDLMGSAFLTGDSFGINEANPPADGDAMWFGMVAFGQQRPATPAGTLLTTVMFDALAVTPGTPVSFLPSATHPPRPTGYTKILNLAGDMVLGTLGSPATVVVVPEPGTLAMLLLGGLVLGRRR